MGTGMRDTDLEDKYKVPYLMPYQWTEFNGDVHLAAEFLKLKEEFKITTVVETGTFLGSTTMWLIQNFKYVSTVEINKAFLKVAEERIADIIGIGAASDNEVVGFSSMDSVEYLKQMDSRLNDKTIFWLDAHGEAKCPLIEELEVIADMKIQPVVVIHDFMVPGRPDLGYDEYNGQKFELSWVLPQLEKIYKNTGMSIRYNDQATGAKRGVLICCPLKSAT